MRRSSVGIVAALASLVVAGGASAKTYCVPNPAAGCSASTASLQQALQEADTAPGGNVVKIEPVTYEASAGCAGNNHTAWTFTYKTTIVGAGVGKTILTCDPGYDNNNTYERILQVGGPVAVSNLTIALPAGASDRGLGLGTGALAKNIAVTTKASATNATAVIIEGATMEDSSVAASSTDPGGVAIEAFGGTIDNATVTADGEGIQADDGTTVEHAHVTAPEGVTLEAGTAAVFDSLIDVTSSAFTPYGIATQDSNGAAVLELTAGSDTIVGSPSGAVGVMSQAAETGQRVSVSLSNSVIDGPTTPIERFSATGSNTYADLTATYDDYRSGSYAGTGPGTTSQSDVLHDSSGFLNSAMGKYELAPDSPLIDAGRPGALSAHEPITDLAGRHRILAGKGTCTYRRDIGAYEYAPLTLPASAAALPKTVVRGKPVKFTATGCSIDPFLSPKFAWALGDGTSASGADVTHTFAKAGTYHATVTVSDPAGRKGTATVAVDVT